MEITGERFVLNRAFGDIEPEHVHRYKIAARLAKGLDVLDAACGAGYGSYMMSESARSVIGIDISEETVNYSREHFNRDNLQYRVASVDQIPLPDHSIDLVVSFETIEHVAADVQEKFLREIKRVLRPNGRLIMSSPDKLTYSDLPHYHNEYHVHELYVDEFKELIGRYFARAEYFTQGLTTQRMDLVKPLSSMPARLDVLGDVHVQQLDERYILTLASDAALDASDVESFNSMLPYNYSDEARLHIDVGAGFQYVTVSKVKYLGGELKEADFDLTNFQGANIKSLMFVPETGAACIASIVDCKPDVKFNPINAVQLNRRDTLFLSTSPRYISAPPPYRAARLNIKYNLRLISFGALENHFGRLFQQYVQTNEALSKENAALKKKLNALADILNSN